MCIQSGFACTALFSLNKYNKTTLGHGDLETTQLPGQKTLRQLDEVFYIKTPNNYGLCVHNSAADPVL